LLWSDDAGIPFGDGSSVFFFGFGRTVNSQMDAPSVDDGKSGVLPIAAFLSENGGLFWAVLPCKYLPFFGIFAFLIRRKLPKLTETLTVLTFFGVSG